jgi:hypothetical protein
LGRSECALSSFDDRSYVNQDFSVDAAQLRARIQALATVGGTDYEQGFLSALAGGVEMAKTARRRPVLFFLTDGAGSISAETVIAAANPLNIAVIPMVFGGERAPESLREIARRTGGACFDRIGSEEEAAATALRALAQVSGVAPCALEWQSGADCADEREITLTWSPARARGFYRAPASERARLAFEPPFLALDSVPPGATKEYALTLTAIGGDFTLNELAPPTLKSGTLELRAEIQPPVKITAQTSASFVARFTATDSAHIAGVAVEAKTAECGSFFLPVSGGFHGRRGGRQSRAESLRLNAPNGGEIYGIGETATIEWQGSSPDEAVALEYSLDSGATWRIIDPAATGLRREWETPYYTSVRALMRVSTRTTGATVGAEWSANERFPRAEWNKDGTRLLLASNALSAFPAQSANAAWSDSSA